MSGWGESRAGDCFWPGGIWNSGHLQIVKWFLSPPWLYINWGEIAAGPRHGRSAGVWAEDTDPPLQGSANSWCHHRGAAGALKPAAPARPSFHAPAVTGRGQRKPRPRLLGMNQDVSLHTCAFSSAQRPSFRARLVSASHLSRASLQKNPKLAFTPNGCEVPTHGSIGLITLARPSWDSAVSYEKSNPVLLIFSIFYSQGFWK